MTATSGAGKRGGKREGAGRPPKATKEKGVKLLVSLQPEQAEWLKKHGISETVQRLVEEDMNWITRHYPIGKEMTVPHPFADSPQFLPCKVTRHLLGGFNNGRVAGITVEFEDRTYMDIDDQYLREDGTGL